MVDGRREGGGREGGREEEVEGRTGGWMDVGIDEIDIFFSPKEKN